MKRRSSGYRRSPAHRSQQRLLGQTYGYLMANIPYFFINKWGISDKTSQRRQSVDKSTPGAVLTIATLKLNWGYWCEQIVHWLYAPINVQLWRKASGKEEWFMTVNPVCFAALLAAEHFAGWHVSWTAKLFVFFSPPIWLDGLLWLLVFAVGRVLVFGALSITTLYIISHI